jgi:1-deoxy-D-xylulose-5-phosphate reductoisomerase
MGRKISVDSATLMNKGLEVIEARWLFNAEPDQIEVVVHPQSIIHSLVAFRDGSVLAQMGNPDMRTPIANALAWPKRIDAGVGPLDLASMAKLEFRQPDTTRFPCLALAFDALRAGDHAPVVLNAANEIAVEAFLNGEIAFMRIAGLIAEVLDQAPACDVSSLDQILACDHETRDRARHVLHSGEHAHV